MGQSCESNLNYLRGEKQSTQEFEATQSIRYENGKFQSPSKIPFHNIKSLHDIEKAAFKFCEENDISLDYLPSISRVIAYHQDRVFLAAFNKVKDNEHQKEEFMEEVHQIPQDEIDLFYHNFAEKTKQRHQSEKQLQQSGSNTSIKVLENLSKIGKDVEGCYSVPKYVDLTKLQKDDILRLYEKGIEQIKAEKVGLVLMCAGSSSRFNFEPKFLSPLNLKQNPKMTILDFLFLRIIKSFGTDISMPIVIAYNSDNFKKVQNFFSNRDYYGLDKMNFRYVEIQSLPVLNLQGKYCLDSEYKLIKRPSGTSRIIQEVLKSNCYNFLKHFETETLHFIGTENLLEQPCDPFMLGLMEERHKKLTAKCVEVNSQWEKLPRYVAFESDSEIYDDRSSIYSNAESVKNYRTTTKTKKILFKLWNELKSEKDKLPSSQQSIGAQFPVATNSIMISLKYLEKLIKEHETDIHLSENNHIIRKNQKVLSFQTEKVHDSECLTFEGDIRDLVGCCRDPLLVMSDRGLEYAPIISKFHEYSLNETVNFYKERLGREYQHSEQMIKKYV